MTTSKPVTDWATDWTHFDLRWVEDPFPIWEDLRSRCPIAHSMRFEDGAFFPSTYEYVREIAYDSDHFSSRRVIVREKKVELQPNPPITSDPPEHTAARKLLLPAFTEKAIQRFEARTRQVCIDLLDNIGGVESCDASIQYAQHIPVLVISEMLGLPADDGDRFRDWIHRLLEVGPTDPIVADKALQEITLYFVGQVADRKPGGHLFEASDLISFLLSAKINDEPLQESHLVGTLRLLLIAGIDTTWSAIGSSIWHLSTNPKDLRRLVNDPNLIPTAIEEFLRAYSPVTMAREVVKETSLGGCNFTVGSQILLSFPAANRDPSVFEQADRVIIDRQENPHVAFGLGRHRCLGSNLARMEIRVALEEWLRRHPVFSLKIGEKVKWSEGTVRGPRTLPVTLGKSEQVCE
ncbi:MAG: cytochrome P450 [Betaproteobacteria bacterium]|nr:cytochrome P450 [Betaproteobacteria bacterium]